MHQTIDATNATLTESNCQPSTIRNHLEQARRFRIEQLQELAADAVEGIISADDPRVQVARVLKLAAESALAEIEGALRRLDQGTYGTCERCTNTIPWERLQVLPMTGLCTSCQWEADFDRGRSGRSRAPHGNRTW